MMMIAEHQLQRESMKLNRRLFNDSCDYDEDADDIYDIQLIL